MSKDSSEFDKLILNDIYPDVKSLFHPGLLSIKDIKDDCLIVLDTNVLLIPYKTSSDSLKTIGEVYKKLKEENRLYVPAQVVREFAKNRGNKLVEIKKELLDNKSKKQSYNLKYPLLESFQEFTIIKELEQKINDLLKDYSKKIESLIDHIDNFSWDDPVSRLYGELLNDIIHDANVDRTSLEKDLKRRITHSIPPGYKDKDKPDGGIGDLLIWHTILSLAVDKKRNLLFVTNEQKEDWWYKNGDMILYPRYELVDEYRRMSVGKTFHMISLSSFLTLYEAKQEVVSEVKQKEENTTKNNANFLDQIGQTYSSTDENNVSDLWRYFVPIEAVINPIYPPFGTSLRSIGINLPGNLKIGSKVMHIVTGKTGVLIGLGSALGTGVVIVRVDEGSIVAARPEMYVEVIL